MAKTEYLQIRIAPEQKAVLRRRAEQAGQDLSTYVLSRALPAGPGRFEEILTSLADAESARFGLAELSDFLEQLTPSEWDDAVGAADLAALSPFMRSYAAAMVEVAATRKGVDAPAWTADVAGPPEPWFATSLRSVRLHLLVSSPVPFRRRNLFVDATVGDRV